MPFGSLWVPVLVSAVAVFVLSSVIHMALRYHRFDYRGLPNEDAVREVLGKEHPAPGLYTVPYCSDHRQMAEPAMVEKYAKGPVAMIAVIPSGSPAMMKSLLQWFALNFFVSFVVGYVARHTLHHDSAGLLVMRVTGSVAFCCYGIGRIGESIWGAIPWSNTVRALIDAALFAIATGLVFRYLWPA